MQANAVNVFMGIMSGFDPSECLLMLAQVAAPAGGKPPEVNPLVQFMPFILMALMGYFMLLRPQQKEARRRQALLANLKKNDKVVTVGGMIGTIADFSSDGTRVTLKVDDTTRIRFLRSSIQGPLDDKSDGDSSTAAG